jgi:adenine-specific DNA-methyltransferase
MAKEHAKISTTFSIDNDSTLYNGDCLELLKQMPDGVVDLVVTSPPYCMGKSYEDPKDDLITFFDKHTQQCITAAKLVLP